MRACPAYSVSEHVDFDISETTVRFKLLSREYHILILQGTYSGIHKLLYLRKGSIKSAWNYRMWQWVCVSRSIYVKKKFGWEEEVMFCLWLSLPSALATQMYCAAQLASQHQAMYVIKWLHHRLYNQPQLYSFFYFLLLSPYISVIHSFFLSFIALLALGILTPTCLLKSDL